MSKAYQNYLLLPSNTMIYDISTSHNIIAIKAYSVATVIYYIRIATYFLIALTLLT